MIKGFTISLVLLRIWFFFIVLTRCCSSAPDAALITSLPGISGFLPSNHYAGYITIDESHGKKFYYYFVESERIPSEDPLVLWLNGGPGCSSLDGFVNENGPFNFEKIGRELPKLHLNKYSWSKVSNILYLESPAGVGFSYSNNVSDYETGDFQTASDNYSFLLKWFELFPEFLPNRFFISGESYAGIYIPTLASKVMQEIDAGSKPTINFEGYLIGNGVTDLEFDGNSLVPFAYGMGLISDEIFTNARNSCRGNYFTFVNDECESHIARVHEATEALNKYNILEPCFPGNRIRTTTDPESSPLFRKLGETERMFRRSWPVQAPVRDGIVPSRSQILNDHLPCTDYEAATWWLNNYSVRKAINADEESVSGPWQICSDKLNYSHDSGSMIPYHRTLTKRGYRALIYSGDHDMCIPFTGTEAWTRAMGYAPVDKWRPWFSGEQVAGYTQGYDYNFTFLTVKGSGHMVPQYKPKESLDFYSRFLNNKPI